MAANPVRARRADRARIAAMERVLGIGGVFFRADDPGGLAGWYEKHLGVKQTPTSYDESSWEQDAGPTIFAPFPADSDHFKRDDQQWAINFRVRDLDAMVAQLRAAGIAVDVDPEPYPNGRFADLVDPNGTPIQLWEPAAD